MVVGGGGGVNSLFSIYFTYIYLYTPYLYIYFIFLLYLLHPLHPINLQGIKVLILRCFNNTLCFLGLNKFLPFGEGVTVFYLTFASPTPTLKNLFPKLWWSGGGCFTLPRPNTSPIKEHENCGSVANIL